MRWYQMILRRSYLRRYTRPRPRSQKPRTGRDAAYRLWIRSLRCLVCASHGATQCTPTEGHHYGPRAFGRKTPDSRLIPLCAVHHRTGSASVHVLGRSFAAVHGLDIEAAIVEFNERYRRGPALEAA